MTLSGAERLVYETMRLDAKNELEQDSKVNMNALVKKGWNEEPTKISALRELVFEIVAGGNRVLIFS